MLQATHVSHAMEGPKAAVPFIAAPELKKLIDREIETYKAKHPTSLRLFTEGKHLIGGVPMVSCVEQ